MKPMLSAAIGFGTALTVLGYAANAQSPYDGFEPPLGFYMDYNCFDPDNSYSGFEATIYSSQGGLLLASDSGALVQGVTAEIMVPAIFDQGDIPYAWQYEFSSHHESGDTMEMIFTDVWDRNDFDELTLTRYPAAFNGAPRAPQITEYVCQSVGGGVDPFRDI